MKFIGGHGVRRLARQFERAAQEAEDRAAKDHRPDSRGFAQLQGMASAFRAAAVVAREEAGA